MAKCQPSMKSNTGCTCLESCLETPGDGNRCKIRLELRKGLQGCTPFFCVSVSCRIDQHFLSAISDKMQTKTAKKKTQDHSQVSQIFIQLTGFPRSIAKVVTFNEKSKSPLSLDHLINESAYPNLSCLGDGFEFVPGVPVNGDDHLHPLVLRISGFPPCSRSCTSPCVVCHHINPP